MQNIHKLNPISEAERRIDTNKSMIQIYSYLIEYGPRNKYLAGMDQIVALTTLVHEVQGTIESNTISLATKTEEQATAQPTKKNSCPQKGPYTVNAWRLLKKEDIITVDKKTWYWCTKDHFSKRIVHNVMYNLHKTCEHDAQRKDLDEKKSKADHINPKASTTTSTTKK